MPERTLTDVEAKNLESLNGLSLESTPLFLTPTGFTKSICDATAPIRRFFLRNHIHDYSTQGQGPGAKRMLPVSIVGNDKTFETEMSVYRPVTKHGDPRLWVAGMRDYADGDDALVFFQHDSRLYLLNLSKINLDAPAVKRFLDVIRQSSQSVVQELLAKLRVIAQHPIEATCTGDTAIGRSVETALGIQMNCSPKPDYKGIELKAKRRNSLTKDVLFAKVPDWSLSKLKSSRELLERCGYVRDGFLHLYCTVSAVKPNSQGLCLKVDDLEEVLGEWESKPPVPDERLLVWKMDSLEAKLCEKHNETFWISAKSEKIGSKECFWLQSVIHTSRPNVPQFGHLLSVGDITVDHLVRMRDSRVSERGPLFKIKPNKLNQLFLGKPETFSLV